MQLDESEPSIRVKECVRHISAPPLKPQPANSI